MGCAGVLAAVLAVGGVATAFAVNAGGSDDDTPQPVEMGKDDATEARNRGTAGGRR